MQNQIAVARDFTRYPGPRYKGTGPFSAQEFRESILEPALRKAIECNNTLVVKLDDVAGYGSSFLEETFGGLIRSGFSKQQLDSHLVISAETPRFRHHALRALEYIKEAASRLTVAH